MTQQVPVHYMQAIVYAIMGMIGVKKTNVLLKPKADFLTSS